jgi:hypothetical protein
VQKSRIIAAGYLLETEEVIHMILARKTYDGYTGYQTRADIKPNKVTLKVVDGRKDKRVGRNYQDDNGFWFYPTEDL